MSNIVARAAFRATPRLQLSQTARRFAATAEQTEGKEALKKGARRDPELIILGSIMCGAFALVGWHFSRNPTSSSSEQSIAQAENSKPWQEGGGQGKYQYHPGGDPNAPRKDAPSALNTVIIPNVTLPKELHDQFNKFGKDEKDY